MMDLIVQSLILISIVTGTLALIGKQIGENFLLDMEKERLREKFENWWLTVADYPPRQLISRILKKVDETIDAYLGQKLFSKKSFRRCGIISLSLLSCTLLLLGLLTKNHGLITPWKNYHSDLQLMKSVAQRESPDVQTQKLNKTITEAVERFDTTRWTITFSAAYYTFLFLINAIGFFLTSGFLRKLLKVLVETSDFFVVVSLFVFTTVLTFIVATICIFIIGVVGHPILWLITGLGIFLATLSLRMAFLIALSAGEITWFFANPALQVSTAVIFSPLILAMAVVGFTFSMLLNPRIFYWVVGRILLLCAEKEPITIIAALLAVISGILAFVIEKIK